MARTYDLAPADIAIPTDTSPRAKWEKTRKPPASMREFAINGHDVMRVHPEQRPRGWKTNDVIQGPAIFPGDVSLVPECNGEDGIPDWAIAEVVRTFANAGPDVLMKNVCAEILEAAALLVKEYRQ